MFGFFTPRCPLELYEKVWIEQRMTFLADRLGMDRLRKAKVLELQHLPTQPDELFTQLRDHLGVRIPVTWEAVDELPAADAAPLADGRYVEADGAATIRIETRQLSQRESLAAAFIHELCRAILLGEQHLAPDDSTAEPTTELLSVFLGSGVMTANSCLDFAQFSNGVTEGYEFRKRRHLAADAFGYALALFCWKRDESPKHWQDTLRLDARDAMLRGLKFLLRTNDSVFTDRAHSFPSTGAIEDDLLGKSDSRRLRALWILALQDSIDNQLTEALRACLDHSEPQFLLATLQLLQKHPQLAVEHLERLEELLAHERASIPMHVLRVVAQLPPEYPHWLHLAETKLKSTPHSATQLAAMDVLASDKSRAEDSIHALLDFARVAVARDTVGLEEAIAAIKKLTSDLSPIAAELQTHVTDESVALRLSNCFE